MVIQHKTILIMLVVALISYQYTYSCKFQLPPLSIHSYASIPSITARKLIEKSKRCIHFKKDLFYDYLFVSTTQVGASNKNIFMYEFIKWTWSGVPPRKIRWLTVLKMKVWFIIVFVFVYLHKYLNSIDNDVLFMFVNIMSLMLWWYFLQWY